ncbi:MAG TPA: VWA domain-containing protein [Phycisphaerae bacterium]|nr:VWA domain-containing protein [Phycisphaerae bacterium]
MPQSPNPIAASDAIAQPEREALAARVSRSAGSTEMLAWGISLVAHVGVFALLASLTWSLQANEGDKLVIPEARLAREPGEPIRVPEPADKAVSTPLEQTELPAYKPSQQQADFAWRRPARSESDLKIIGIGTGGGLPLAGGLSGPGSESGPRAEFFGAGGNAYRICYVIDRSGSMLDSFEYVRRELKRSINDLVPQQQFHVIFFNAGEPVENPPRAMIHATSTARQKTFDFLDQIVPGGQTDPSRALERAFSLVPPPELIYFMTDGEFDPSVVEKLRHWNQRKRVKINTIAFLYELGDVGGVPLLRRIAREHGGVYRFVGAEDLGP